MPLLTHGRMPLLTHGSMPLPTFDVPLIKLLLSHQFIVKRCRLLEISLIST